MGFTAQERRHTLYGLAAFLSLTALVLFTLWRLPPELYSFYPACPVRTYLHFECPGCGSTRALSALLHGHLSEALRLNALFVVLVLPLAVIYMVVACTRAFRSGVFCWPVIPQAATWIAFACAAAFTLLRNMNV
jgi:hypothetical protein